MAIPIFPTVDKWPLHPFDPKCKKFVSFDPVVDEQIRCKVPLWSGNFGELKPELTAEGQGLRLADLPLLTVYDVGQYVIRAAQGGSLRAGAIGTAAHCIVTSPLLACAADDAFYNRAADTFGDEHWKILEVCKARDFVDRATAQSEETITAYVVGGGDKPARGVLSDMRRQFDLLRKQGFIKRERGVGTWLSQEGLHLLKVRKTKLNRLFAV